MASRLKLLNHPAKHPNHAAAITKTLGVSAMQPLQDFLQHNFIWFFLFCLVWVIVGFGYRYCRHKQTGVVFPDVPSASIHFDERAASGCSYKTMFTKFGGARNCLHVILTR